MKKVTLIAVAGALLIPLSIVSLGQGRQGRGGPPGGGFPGGAGSRDGLGALAGELNLSDAQKTQIQKITESFQESTKALQDQLRTLRASDPDPLGSFDEAAFRATAEARAKVDVELSVARAKTMSQIFAVLTADQKAQLAAKEQRSERRPPPPSQ